MTVQDAKVGVWVRAAPDADQLLCKEIITTVWRNGGDGINGGYPAAWSVKEFFQCWRKDGVAEISGRVIRWEDFICADVTYTDREVTLP